MDIQSDSKIPVTTTGRTRSDFEVNDQKRKKAFPSLHSRRRVNKGWVTFRELDFPTNERPSIYHRGWNLVTIVFHVSRFLTTVTTAPRETTLTFTVSQRSFNEYTGGLKPLGRRGDVLAFAPVENSCRRETAKSAKWRFDLSVSKSYLWLARSRPDPLIRLLDPFYYSRVSVWHCFYLNRRRPIRGQV